MIVSLKFGFVRCCLLTITLSFLLVVCSSGQRWYQPNNQPLNDATTFATAPSPAIEVFEPASEKRNGTALLILPGGGYGTIVWEKEGANVAKNFASKGITCFVLKYRLPRRETMPDFTTAPLTDAQAALGWIKEHATDFKLDTAKIGVIGFSAGGHLAATLANHHAGSLAFQILVYPVISMQDSLAHPGSRLALLGEHPTQALKDAYSNELQVNLHTPPAYITHAGDDSKVPVQNSIRYYEALLAKHIPAELHLYPTGDHGFIFHLPKSEWFDPMILWLEKSGFIPLANRKTVVLTFDDAPQSHYSYVAPMLKQLGFDATFYVCEFPKVYPDSTISMNWRQMAEIGKMGFEIGNHTWHHTKVPGITEKVFTSELAYIEKKIDSLRLPVMTSFCYPAYSTDTLAIRVLKQRGYFNARTGGDRAYDPKTDNPFYIPSYTIKEENKQLFHTALEDAKEGQIVVFTFHGIPDTPHPWVSTNPATFTEMMQYLFDHHYRVIAMRDLPIR